MSKVVTLGAESPEAPYAAAVAGADAPRSLVDAADLVLDGPGAAVGFLIALAARLYKP